MGRRTRHPGVVGFLGLFGLGDPAFSNVLFVDQTSEWIMALGVKLNGHSDVPLLSFAV